MTMGNSDDENGEIGLTENNLRMMRISSSRNFSSITSKEAYMIYFSF